jgi:lipoprotein-anchoring transpeptidase ErfK/SrfK
VRADNPPVDQLRYGALVTIYAETVHDGAVWYRIGDDRWVHSGWIELVAASLVPALSATPRFVQANAARGGDVTLPVGWVVASVLDVRTLPGDGAGSVVIDQVYHNQSLDILETQRVDGDNWYRIGADRWVYGGSVGVAREKARPSTIGGDERWVGVNLSEQTVVAYEGDRPVYAALAATGLPGTATVQGIFRTWWRLTSRKMAGGSGSGYYYLEEVTWTCYFYSGYALHTAYWHDAFGRPRSHGCVNLSPYDAWWLFQWSEPGGANSPAVYVYWQ